MNQPHVGMGVSFLYGTDTNPGTIFEVQKFKTGPRTGQIRRIGVREDNWTVVSGSEHDGSAQYEYESDENAPLVWFSKNKDGRWVSPKGQKLSVGTRRRYRDPSF